MTFRFNGCGTTMSPFPGVGCHSISLHWFTIFYIPLIPLGWYLIEGTGYQQYRVLRKLTINEASKTLGRRGVVLSVLYGYFINIIYLILILGLIGGVVMLNRAFGLIGVVAILIVILFIAILYDRMKG